MSHIKPWMRPPFELIRHAEKHLQGGTDFDRRMALISYDNAIEMAIITYLSLHPDQRSGRTFVQADVDKWSRNYHTKLDFLQYYLNEAGRPMSTPRDEIIYYHSLRNDLYHAGRGLVPSENDMYGIRNVALWVFSELFDADVELLLSTEEPLPVLEAVGRTVSEKTMFMEAIIEMRRDLNELLRLKGLADTNDLYTTDATQAMGLLVAGSHGDYTPYQETVRKAELMSDALAKDEPVLQDKKELEAIASEIEKVSKVVTTQLREYQQKIVEKAVIATLHAASPQGDRRAGIVLQTQGSGLAATVLHYVKHIHQVGQFKTIVVVTGNVATDNDLFELFTSKAEGLPIFAKQAESANSLVDLITSHEIGVIFTTIQKFQYLPIFKSDKNILVVIYKVLSLGAFMSSLRSVLPDATFIQFANTPVTDDHRRAFGETISVYDWKSDTRDHAVVPIHVEKRHHLIEEYDQSCDIVDLFIKNHPWLAEDVVSHLESRLSQTGGKALIVVSNRRAVVRLYDTIAMLRPTWHNADDAEGTIKAVMTASYTDPLEWRLHTRTKTQLQELAERFIDPESGFKVAITSGLWLTGMDVPSLDTLYICRPMQGAMLFQAIARITRSSKKKSEALVVDYIGIDFSALSETLGSLYVEKKGS